MTNYYTTFKHILTNNNVFLESLFLLLVMGPPAVFPMGIPLPVAPLICKNYNMWVVAPRDLVRNAEMLIEQYNLLTRGQVCDRVGTPRTSKLFLFLALERG